MDDRNPGRPACPSCGQVVEGDRNRREEVATAEEEEEVGELRRRMGMVVGICRVNPGER